MILILTGPTRSHKTTTLLRWANERNDCGGILTPDENGLRVIYNVKEKKSISFEKQEINSAHDLRIGRFVFDSERFAIASGWFNDHLNDPGIHYLLLDEIGPLELNGKGWDQCLRKSLPILGNKTLILVIRQHLLDDLILHYSMKEVRVVEKEFFFPDPANL